MKKTLIVLFVIAALIAAAGSIYCCARTFTGKQIRGSGRMTTRTVELAAFNKIEASRAVQVQLVNDGTSQARIEADDNLIDDVVVRVEDKTLIVGIKPGIQSVSNINVRVTVPTDGRLSELEVSSAARISGDLLLTGEKLELEASSAAMIDIKAAVTEFTADASSAATIAAQLEATHCKVEATSASTIRISGKAAKCEAELSSASKFIAADFAVENYDISTSSAANAKVNCTSELRAEASSGSSISYTGNCRANTHASSGGSIKNR